MTFTKEQLIARARFLIKRHQDSLANHPDQDGVTMDLELARMALAGMEAEPVAFYQHDGTVVTRGSFGFNAEPGKSITLYSAPPAQAAQETTDREMLKRLAVILSGSDAPGEIRSLTVTARSFVERCKTLAKERVASRDAMQSGANMAAKLESALQHIAELEAAPPAPVGDGDAPLEFLPDFPGRTLTQRECYRAGFEAGKALKDGWVAVPVEPTAEMISSGIAAHYERTKIQIHDRPAPGPMECAYVAMIAAAPQQEVKPL